MRTHSSDYKESLKGIKETDNKIFYTIGQQESELDSENFFDLKKITNADLLTTVMKTFSFTSNKKLPNDTMFNLQSGLKVNGNYEYLDYGNFFLKEPPKYDLNSKKWEYECFDKMLFTMKDYVAPEYLTFPITVREYIKIIADECGLTFALAESTFVNYDKEILQDNYADGGYTYRDILDELSKAVCGWFYINDDDELDIKYPTETNEEFDNSYLLNINVDFNKKYGPVNSVVFSRAEGADNIYRRDERSIADNGLCELKISDNSLLDGDNREDFIDEIFNTIKGLEFYIMDVDTTGLMFLDVGDLFGFRIEDDFPALKSGIVKSGIMKARGFQSGARKCLLLNSEVDLSSGMKETIFADEPEISETDYKSASLTDKGIKNAILKVNKATAEIELKVSKDEIISAINLSPEEITINANKIKLEGYTTINGKFAVDTDGNMTATGGRIGNFVIDQYSLKGGSGNNQVGMCSTSGQEYAFWAGADVSANAPFRVSHNGSVRASNIAITGGSVDIHTGVYYLTMGVSTGNPSVSGLNVGGYGVKAYSGIVATGFGITDSDSGKSGTFILKHGTQNRVVYLTFTGGILTAYDIV